MSGSDAANGAAATELDAGARLATVLLSVATSVGLLLVWQGVQHKWALFEAPPRLLLALTALTVVPVLVALLLHRGRERAPWIAGLLYLLLLAPLAWHTGCAVMPGISPNTLIYLCYWLALVAATFALPPLLQARRSHGSAFHYPALFEHACNNALSLAVAGVFVLACGLVLLLWQALFAVIGIHLFERLFQRAEFLYPAAGLAGGMGLVIGRSQLGAVRTALNICLMLGRALFPVVAALALLFLGTAVFSRFEALWQTRHASALLLVLLFAVVALYNAVHQDGLGSVVQGRPLRLLTQAALLVLPVYAGLAAYSLWLRVAQHGWTEERLWACLIDAVAALYAMAYAAAVLAARGGRLSLLDWANPRIAVAAVAVLLLTQSPLLDFRAIAVRAQVADALAPGHDPKLLDLNYLRFHAGRPGNEALQRLQGDPRVNAAMQTSIAAVLKQTYIYQSPAPAAGGIDAQFRALTQLNRIAGRGRGAGIGGIDNAGIVQADMDQRILCFNRRAGDTGRYAQLLVIIDRIEAAGRRIKRRHGVAGNGKRPQVTVLGIEGSDAHARVAGADITGHFGDRRTLQEGRAALRTSISQADAGGEFADAELGRLEAGILNPGFVDATDILSAGAAEVERQVIVEIAEHLAVKDDAGAADIGAAVEIACGDGGGQVAVLIVGSGISLEQALDVECEGAIARGQHRRAVLERGGDGGRGRFGGGSGYSGRRRNRGRDRRIILRGDL